MDVGTLLARLQLDTSEFDKGLSTAEGKASGFGAKLGPLLTAGAMAAVAGLATALVGIGSVAVNAAGEASQGVKSLQAELGLTEKAAQELGQEALEVFKNNFTGSITEAHEAIAEASRQLGEFVDPTQLGELASGALAVADIFEADYPQVLNSARTLMDRFGLDGQQALDFIAKGFQSGLNNSGDFLDTIGEYSNLFAESEFSASEFFSAMQTGLQGGVLGTDKIADAFKEFNIRVREGTDEIWGPDGALQMSLGMTSEKVNALWEGMQNGTVTVADVYAEVAPLLAAMDNDVWRNTVGVQLFGTQWEDLGASAILGVDLSKTALADMAGATDSLAVKYTSLADVGETLWRRTQVALIPVGDALLQLANAVMPYVLAAFSWFEQQLPGWIEGARVVIATMVAAVSALFQGPLAGSLAGAQSNFQSIGRAISEVMAAASAVVGSYLGVITEFWNRNGSSILAFAQTTWNTIGSIISTVMQLIQAIVVPIWTAVAGFINSNQATIVAYFTNAWNGISGLITGVLGFIQGLLKAVLAAIQGDWTGAWNNIKEASASLVSGLWAFIKSAFENGKLVCICQANS